MSRCLAGFLRFAAKTRPALRLSGTKNRHFANAPFPRFSAAAVTPVLPDPESVIPLQPAPELAVTPVIPVTLQNSQYRQNNVNKLNAQDQARLMAYLKAIGETDSSGIEEFVSECAANPDILHYALQLAEDTLRIHHGDTRGFVRCASCRFLNVQEQRCSQFGWRIVLDKWRRCKSFKQR